LNRRDAFVETETSDQEEARDQGITSAAAEALCSLACDGTAGCSCVPIRRDLGWRPWREIGAGRKRIGFKSFMHFSFYLMIAALVLVGFEVAYALYQLTVFVL
jgi:hypothetical protein